MQEMSLTSFWIIAGSCVLVLGIMILKNRARFAFSGARGSGYLRHRMCEQMARTAGNHACRRHQSGDPFDNRKPWF